MRARKVWIVLIAVLLLLAACKGETPTAPPPSGGTPPGGTPPPTGVNVTITASNSDPLVDSTVTITATVTDSGNPVPNGTAVEFVATGGVLNGNGTAVLKTTTNGAASVTLTATAAGSITVTATVNNVTRSVSVTFRPRPVTTPPPNTTPSITAVTPSVGRPAGGELIRITGVNFKAPVRVLFDTGSGIPIEAFVVSVSDDGKSIEAITPAVNLGAGQQLAASIIVLTQAGTTSEQRAELEGAFTFRNERLTPIISTITPNSGPVTGGTRVTIIGEGFQEPVQVLFDTAEARVLNVTFSQILVETPAGRDTGQTGSGPVLGAVPVTVRNINSNTQASSPNAFNYKAAMQITAVGPGEGLFTGGTRITIDGIGFVGPVTVSMAGVPAQVISVAGTKIIAISPAVQIEGCSDLVGPVIVTNIVNGDQATGPDFAFRVPPSLITNVSPRTVTIGVDSNVTVTVANAKQGVNRIQLGDKTVFPTSVSIDPVTGVGIFTVPLPTNFDFPTEACGTGGERLAPLDVDVTYENANTECEDTATEALTINPADSSCVLPPTPDINVVTPVPPNCLVINTAGPLTPANGTIRIENVGTSVLTVSATATPAAFTILPTNAAIPPGGGFQDFIVTFTPAGVDVNGNVAFTSDDPDEPTVNVCLNGNVP